MDKTERRSAALAGLQILDTLPEPEYDAIVRIAQKSLCCEIALISLIDLDRQWFNASVGLSAVQTPIEHSFCAIAADADAALIVNDARLDARFASNPLVLGYPFIRFYAGVPIHVKSHSGIEGIAIGTICVIDSHPREISDADLKVLHDLAQLVESMVSARLMAIEIAALAKERQVNLEHLNRKQRQFRQAERLANFGSWRLCLVDNSVEWSDQVFAIHGLPLGQQPALESALDFYPPEARAAVSAAISNTVETGQPFDFESDFLAADGVAKRVRSLGEIESFEGRAVAIIGVFQDITQQYQLRQELQRRASTDDLTQLGNRAACDEAVDDAIAAARADGGPLSLMLIDLDGFKLVNDTYGHAVGDEILRLIGARLHAAYLRDCFVGRLGGDEFIIVSSHSTLELDALVRRVLADLRLSFDLPDGMAGVSGTIGVARFGPAVRNRKDFLQRADQALYEAKTLNRGAAKTFGAKEYIFGDDSLPPTQRLGVA